MTTQGQQNGVGEEGARCGTGRHSQHLQIVQHPLPTRRAMTLLMIVQMTWGYFSVSRIILTKSQNPAPGSGLY